MHLQPIPSTMTFPKQELKHYHYSSLLLLILPTQRDQEHMPVFEGCDGAVQ